MTSAAQAITKKEILAWLVGGAITTVFLLCTNGLVVAKNVADPHIIVEYGFGENSDTKRQWLNSNCINKKEVFYGQEGEYWDCQGAERKEQCQNIGHGAGEASPCQYYWFEQEYLLATNYYSQIHFLLKPPEPPADPVGPYTPPSNSVGMNWVYENCQQILDKPGTSAKIVVFDCSEVSYIDDAAKYCVTFIGSIGLNTSGRTDEIQVHCFATLVEAMSKANELYLETVAADGMDGPTCISQTPEPLSWVVCPLGGALSTVVDWLLSAIGWTLRWNYLMLDSDAYLTTDPCGEKTWDSDRCREYRDTMKNSDPCIGKKYFKNDASAETREDSYYYCRQRR